MMFESQRVEKGANNMNEKATVFCINCDKKVDYRIETCRKKTTVRGIEFSYVEETAFCAECGEEVYVADVNDFNVASREDAYREANHIITIAEIRQLMKKYDIGAGPLAKLMGFGEVTVNRYIAGQLPSKEHSNMLYEVLFSHKVMKRKLEENRERITPVAYAKCNEAVERLSALYGSKRIEVVARYILSRAEEITPLALQKLLYYSQAFYHALYGEDLFQDDCQAWAHGPVYSEIYSQYKDYGYNPIEKNLIENEADFSELTNREINLLNAVIDVFGMYSGQILSKITHNEQPWIEARGSLLPSDRSVTVISRKAINSYFDKIVEKYQIINPQDIERYCSDIVACVK